MPKKMAAVLTFNPFITLGTGTTHLSLANSFSSHATFLSIQDRATGELYDLFIENGKLKIEKSV